ncbi:hypothetical protein RhiJN_10242 [Ceratobasidium sp. AG-Ba]|nr:hypothetical protein RhiJN_10242 [Ceratobasidium sp. AG-Ba]QRW10995.1 hypothetical protein RhiLY_09994 [Ceratobasidium sp. AG-Ba]
MKAEEQYGGQGFDNVGNNRQQPTYMGETSHTGTQGQTYGEPVVPGPGQVPDQPRTEAAPSYKQ